VGCTRRRMVDPMGDQKLQGMTTGEVAEKARETGLEKIEQMNKQEVIDALGEAQPQSSVGGSKDGNRGEGIPWMSRSASRSA
jgi:hypothetical protein